MSETGVVVSLLCGVPIASLLTVFAWFAIRDRYRANSRAKRKDDARRKAIEEYLEVPYQDER